MITSYLYNLFDDKLYCDTSTKDHPLLYVFVYFVSYLSYLLKNLNSTEGALMFTEISGIETGLIKEMLKFETAETVDIISLA